MTARFHIKISPGLTGYTASQFGYQRNQQLDRDYNEQHTPAMFEPKPCLKHQQFGMRSGSLQGDLPRMPADISKLSQDKLSQNSFTSTSYKGHSQSSIKDHIISRTSEGFLKTVNDRNAIV